MKTNNIVLGTIALVISVFFAQQNVSNQKQSQSNAFDSKIEQLIESRSSGVMVTIKATVIKLLRDDLKGDRHQKMIIKTGNNTLLLVHNIDIAPRIPVKKGEQLLIKGQYEWNDKGGLVHWTHKSNNNHPQGWIKHNNKIYH